MQSMASLRTPARKPRRIQLFHQKISILLIFLMSFSLFMAVYTPAHGVGENQSCGGVARIIGSVMCDEGLWCDLAPNNCPYEDAPGKCVRVPEPGTCPSVSRPVCGCTGTTYANDCQRLMARDQKDYDGQCRPQ